MKRQAVSDKARGVLRQDDECVLNMLKQTLHTLRTQSQYNPEQEEAERQRLREWNMKQVEEWNKTKEQKLEEMLAQTTKHVLSYCFNIDKERMK